MAAVAASDSGGVVKKKGKAKSKNKGANQREDQKRAAHGDGR